MTENPNRYGRLPLNWIEAWQKHAPIQLPEEWDDPDQLYAPIPRKDEITEKNRITLEKALYPIRSQHKGESL